MVWLFRKRVARLTQVIRWTGLVGLLCACGSEESGNVVKLSGGDDAAVASDSGGTAGPGQCADVTIGEDSVVVHDDAVTAHFAIAGSFTGKTVMLFGGEVVKFDNAVSSVGILALDREDAQVLAMKYPDFYRCDSEGGMEAQDYILPFDLVPANCDIHQQLAKALSDLEIAARTNGDRVSLVYDGATLELQSAAFDNTGEDVSEHFATYQFELVTKVEQVTGLSVVDFGMQ